MEAVTLQRIVIRPLMRKDLASVVAIDASIEGRTRRAYFERRLDAALREPKLHAQFAAVDEKGLTGYILPRGVEGDFGPPAPGLPLEFIGAGGGTRGPRVAACLCDA